MLTAATGQLGDTGQLHWLEAGRRRKRPPVGARTSGMKMTLHFVMYLHSLVCVCMCVASRRGRSLNLLSRLPLVPAGTSEWQINEAEASSGGLIPWLLSAVQTQFTPSTHSDVRPAAFRRDHSSHTNKPCKCKMKKKNSNNTLIFFTPSRPNSCIVCRAD